MLTSQNLQRIKEQLYSELPIIGGGLRRRAAQSLAQDGSPDAVRVLANAIARTADRQVLAISLEALRQIKRQQCIDEVCAVWAVTRHKDLANLLVKKGWVASTPADMKVLSALKAGQLEFVTKGKAEIVEPLLKAFRDADNEIASRANQCVIALTNSDAIDYLCQRWSKTRDKLLEQVILQGKYVAGQPVEVRVLSGLKTGKRKTLASDGVEMITPLLQACKDSDTKIVAEATALLGELQNQLAIDALCSEWAKTRAGVLTEVLQRGQYVAAHPPEVRVLSALKVGRLEAVVDGGVEVINFLLQACKDVDFDIARGGQSALRKLKNPKAQDELSRLVIEQDHKLAREVAVACQYMPRDPNHRALFLFLTEQWDKYESLDFEHILLQTAYEFGDEQLCQRIAQKVRQAGRPEWVKIIIGGRREQQLKEITDAEWEIVFVLLSERKQCEEIWKLSQVSPIVWSVRFLQCLKDLQWVPTDANERSGFLKLVDIAIQCKEELVNVNIKPRSIQLDATNCSGLILSSRGLGLVAYKAKEIHLWSIPQGKKHSFKAHQDSIDKLDFSSESNQMLSLYTDNKGTAWARIWDIEFDKLRCHSSRDPIKDVPYYNGISIFLGFILTKQGNNIHIQERDFKVGYGKDYYELKHKTFLEGHTDSILCVTGHDHFLATGSKDKTVRLWTLNRKINNNYKEVVLQGHTSSVSCLAFSPNGTLVASGSEDKTVKLWSVTDERLLMTFQGHTDSILCLTFSWDGTLVASLSKDNMIKLWSVADTRLLITLQGHTKSIETIAFGQDGLLIGLDTSNTIWLWKVDLIGELLQLMRKSTTQINLENINWIEKTLRSLVSFRPEKIWLEFILNLSHWQRKFDIALEEIPECNEAREFDIEIEDKKST